MSDNIRTLDYIRTGALFDVIEDAYTKDRQPARFRCERNGLQLITHQDTAIKDWTPEQIETALRDLEASDQVRVSFPTHSADSQVTAFPVKFFRSNPIPRRKPSFAEVITLIKTDAEFCTGLVLDIHVYCMGDEYYWYGFELGALPDSEIFEDMAQQLLRHNDITERQLAICRMPDENGIPRLARYKQELDEQYEVANQIKLLFDLQALVQAGLSPIEFIEIDGVLWLLENGLPFEECLRARLETLEALEEAEYVTVRRNYHRVTVTGVFLDEEAAADFQNLMFRYTIESGKINKIIKYLQ